EASAQAGKKKPARAKQKMQRKFFCGAGRHHRRQAAGRSEWIFSGIFDKVGSSEIINILQLKTTGVKVARP
ncbi:MAG TPA: hypothetical protein VJB39_00690, partial [Patescibacteria group bacterium]|nr:hypothetical protein [Patescibacteria group bacterium]